jgi:hypothetical protein
MLMEMVPYIAGLPLFFAAFGYFIALHGLLPLMVGWRASLTDAPVIELYH